LSRIKGEHRAQVFVKGTHRGRMRQSLAVALDARTDVRQRISVDVDPLNVLQLESPDASHRVRFE